MCMYIFRQKVHVCTDGEIFLLLSAGTAPPLLLLLFSPLPSSRIACFLPLLLPLPFSLVPFPSPGQEKRDKWTNDDEMIDGSFA